MSYNGSGTFVINSSGQPVVPGTTISSTAFNALTADLATGLTTAVTKDGQTTPTANLPMGGFKLTGLGAGSAATDSVRMSQLQNGAGATLGTIAGTNTITAVGSPTVTAYAANQVFRFIPAATNTGATTINIDGLGAKNIYWDGAALFGGELKINVPAQIFYDGTQFNLMALGGPVSIAASLGADVALNNTANYFDGPSVAQGTVGTWYVSGTVTVRDPTSAAGMRVKLWDGTTVISSAYATTGGANYATTVALSGYITSPAGNLRISVRDENNTTGTINNTLSGNGKDSTITAIRIG